MLLNFHFNRSLLSLCQGVGLGGINYPHDLPRCIITNPKNYVTVKREGKPEK